MVSVCLKLDPPAPADPDAPPPRPDEPWTLRFFLQAYDEPDLLLPASVIWREPGAEVVYEGRRFEAPQEKLLAGLGRAARMFPPRMPTICSGQTRHFEYLADR